ncbi:MAG: agmatinase [Planctomycetota bacterium]|jgi:agmatinase
MEFDPNAASTAGSGLFGLPHGPEEALVHIVGVPFEATTSYRGGTAHGPDAVLAASRQIDLFDLRFGKPYEQGLWLAPTDERFHAWNSAARSLTAPIIEKGGADEDDAAAVARVNEIGDAVNSTVRAFFDERLGAGQAPVLPVLLGGDHSTPFGAIAACADRYPGLAVLQFDAHADLRPAFEGFRWSHASIMHNVLQEIGNVSRIVQVGIRDLCEQEYDELQSDSPVTALFDTDLESARFEGRTRALARSTIASLPDEIYISFDIDALDPTLCPNTGTPVPGGILWDELMVWLEEISKSGKRVVGLDLNEVSPGPGGDPDGTSWDAIVGARVLYRLIGAALRTQG